MVVAADQVGLAAVLGLEPLPKDLVVALLLATAEAEAEAPVLLALMRLVQVLVALVALALPHLLRVLLLLEQVVVEPGPILAIPLL